MASFSSLHIGVSALSTSQRAVEVAAHNVANASTPGFTRQRLEIATATPTTGTLGLRGDGQRGMGVTVIGVERLRDRLSDVTWRHQAALSGKASAESQVLDRVEQVMGVYGEGNPQALSRFFAAWDQLSLSPADPAARSGVLAAGKALADGLAGAVQGLDQVRSEVGQRMLDRSDEVNSLLRQVASLNGQIRDAEIDLGSPNDLRDARDAALDKISALTGAKVTLVDEPLPGVRSSGSAQVALGDVLLVDGQQVRPVTVDVASEPPSVDPSDGLGGTLGGLLRTAALDVPARRAQLDGLAVALRDAVNAVHVESTGLDGSRGRDFFTGDDALSLRLADGLNETTLAAGRNGQAADGDGALAMSALRTLKTSSMSFATDGSGTTGGPATMTLSEALRAFGSSVGQAAANGARAARSAESGLAGASQTRASLNGVNVDEEMVDLVKFQHAYSAASRVITVIDEMLDKIINQMGR